MEKTGNSSQPIIKQEPGIQSRRALFINNDCEDSDDNGVKSKALAVLDGKFFKYVKEKSTHVTPVGVCVMCLPKKTEIRGYYRSTSNFVNHLKRKHGPDAASQYHEYAKNLSSPMFSEGPRGKRNWRSMTRAQALPVSTPKQSKNGEERTTSRSFGMNETDNGCDASSLLNANTFEAQIGIDSLEPVIPKVEPDETRMPMYPKVEHAVHEDSQTATKSSQTSAPFPELAELQQYGLQHMQKQNTQLTKFFECMEHTVAQFSPIAQIKAKTQIFSVVSQLELSELSNRIDTLGPPQPRQQASRSDQLGSGYTAASQDTQRSAKPHSAIHQDALPSTINAYGCQNNQNSPESTLNGSPQGFSKQEFGLQPHKLG